MRQTRQHSLLRKRRAAMITFEWILLISLLVIGIIGGLSAVRNAILCELQDLANCISALNCCACQPGEQPPCTSCCFCGCCAPGPGPD